MERIRPPEGIVSLSAIVGINFSYGPDSNLKFRPAFWLPGG